MSVQMQNTHWTWSQETLIIILILLRSDCGTFGGSHLSQASVSLPVTIREEMGGFCIISKVPFGLKCQLQCASALACRVPLGCLLCSPLQPCFAWCDWKIFSQSPEDSLDYWRRVNMVCGFKTLSPLSNLYPSLFSPLGRQKPSLSLFFQFGQVHVCFVKSSCPVVKSRVNIIPRFSPLDDKFGSDCHGSIWRASQLILTALEYSVVCMYQNRHKLVLYCSCS